MKKIRLLRTRSFAIAKDALRVPRRGRLVPLYAGTDENQRATLLRYLSMNAKFPPANPPPVHLILAVLITAVWGTNFVVIKVGLDSFPPLWFALLRFILVFFPTALFLARPRVLWRELAAYGLLVGAGQFGLLYIAMRGYISPGLASLVVQSQVFFTIAVAVWRSGERPTLNQYFAIIAGACGLATVALGGTHDATPLGLLMVIAAGLCWALSNVAIRKAPPSMMLNYVVWASLFSIPALLALALIFEGFGPPVRAIVEAPLQAWAALIWQATGNTIFGFATWGWLLSRHPTAVIMPIALLVPVFGMAASVLLLGETLPFWKLVGSGLILLALCGPYVRWPIKS